LLTELTNLPSLYFCYMRFSIAVDLGSRKAFGLNLAGAGHPLADIF